MRRLEECREGGEGDGDFEGGSGEGRDEGGREEGREN